VLFPQLDRVDPLFYAHSPRLDISEETRILANANEAKSFHEANKPTGELHGIKLPLKPN
jgi:ubiquitin conjugation factor E4 B